MRTRNPCGPTLLIALDVCPGKHWNVVPLFVPKPNLELIPFRSRFDGMVNGLVERSEVVGMQQRIEKRVVRWIGLVIIAKHIPPTLAIIRLVVNGIPIPRCVIGTPEHQFEAFFTFFNCFLAC